MRSGLVKAHRYLALTVGIFFVFLGLTGSILAFYPELDRALNPKLDIPHSEKRQSLETVLDNAKKVFPDKFLHSIFWASEDQPFHQVWFTPSGDDQSLMWEVMVHPSTAEVIGQATTLVNAQHKLKSVWMPSETSSYWRVTFRDPVHIGYAGSDVIFLFDAQTGALLRSSNYETDSGIKQALRWQHPLHSGRAFGFWGRAAVFVSGFVPLVLLITGFMIWRRKRAVLQRRSYKEVG